MTEPAHHGSATPQSDDILATKRTQSNPPPIAISATEPGKCAKIDAAQGAKRTHHAPAPFPAPLCARRTPPPRRDDSRATM